MFTQKRTIYLFLSLIKVLRPPMQRGDYPMFIFASHRKAPASDNVVRSAGLSESLLENPCPGIELEKTHDSAPPTLSCSPPPEEYVVL